MNNKWCMSTLCCLTFALVPLWANAAPSRGMVKIPGGTFYAGLHPVRELDIGTFSMDKYEVTQAEYEKVMGNDPSEFKGGNLPVENVTWHEAEEYCRKVGKRLPTEWEWEKAAKGGTTTKYYWGDRPNDAYGWWRGNSGDKSHPVGQKKPNSFGLYDMSGNVWEWTASNYYNNIDIYKVLRGGSWLASPHETHSSIRQSLFSGARFSLNGFRCAQ